MINVDIKDNGKIVHTVNLFKLIYIVIDSILGSIELALRVRFQKEVTGSYRAITPIVIDGNKHRCRALKGFKVKFLWGAGFTPIYLNNVNGAEVSNCEFCARFYYKYTGE